MPLAGANASRTAAPCRDNVGVRAKPSHTFVVADLAGYSALTEAHGDEQAADAAEEFARRFGRSCRRTRAGGQHHGRWHLLRVEEAEHAVELSQRIVAAATHMKLACAAVPDTGTAAAPRSGPGSAVR